VDGPLQRAFAHTIDAKVQAQLSVVREGIGQAFRAIRVDEPDHRVSPSMALSLSMALHDLCTNTAKDGAMSVPDGRVRIT
jgi:two-component sensor histidine kinase